MKLAIITSRYPKKESPYNHMFVHVRAKFFIDQGVEVTVFVPASIADEYVYQGVPVICNHATEIAKQQLNYDVVYLHLLNLYPIKSGGFAIYSAILKHKQKTAIYLHGSDVLTYPEYYYDFEWNVRGIARVLYANIWKRYWMNHFFKGLIQHKKYVVITPSLWLKEQVNKLYKLPLQNFKVIPNGIDVSHFYTENAYEKRYKMLCIRPFDKMYPVEKTIEFLSYLPEEYTLDIFGKGEMKRTLESLIQNKNLSHRIQLKEQFIEREQLPKLLSQYGVFCALSNIDTQGVMMCEAMAASLLVISSNKTAIPEFITHKVSGLLEDDLLQLRDDLLAICADESAFNQITKKAREEMEKITIERVGELELDTLQRI